jgi:hypothetical protein
MKIFHENNPFLLRQSAWRCKPLCRAIVKSIAALPRWQYGTQLRVCRAMQQGAALLAARATVRGAAHFGIKAAAPRRSEHVEVTHTGGTDALSPQRMQPMKSRSAEPKPRILSKCTTSPASNF